MLGWWLAGRLSAPLRELAHQADALQTRPGEPVDRADEVSQLAGSLSSLMRRLQQRSAELAQLNRSLEARMPERTEALADANEHLRSFSHSVSHDLKAPIAADFPGTGVGLSIVKRIVQRHGGRVWAQSVPGQRTSFHFALPRHPPAPSVP